MDVLVDGDVPNLGGNGPSAAVTLTPFEEVYTYTPDAHLHGHGSTTLRVGAHYAVPVE
jgi:hypothetical protein